MTVQAPTKTTLKKYGLTEEEWLAILERQGFVCPVCGKAPSTGRWVTDHEHVRGWKSMPPEKRKLFVRGITCWFCNATYIGRAMTVQKARNLHAYLEHYEGKKRNLAMKEALNGTTEAITTERNS